MRYERQCCCVCMTDLVFNKVGWFLSDTVSTCLTNTMLGVIARNRINYQHALQSLTSRYPYARKFHPFPSDPLYTKDKEWCSFRELDPEHLIVTVGLTDYALEEIGEPTGIEQAAAIGALLPEGAKVLDIVWEGYCRTSGNELYHAVWESRTGVRRGLDMPFSARLLQTNSYAIENPDSILTRDKEEDNWLVQLEVHRGYAESIQRRLLSRAELDQMIELQDNEFKHRLPAPCS